MTKFFTVLIIIFVSLLALSAEEKSIENTAGLLPKQVLKLSKDARISTTALTADKTKRLLSIIDVKVLTEDTTPQTYNIDIGKKSGDKKKRDDKRTPEGVYTLLERKTQPEIPFETYGSLAFTTNYPNYFDKYENKTGSGIWLHSIPDNVALNRGSKGCVVLRNNDIKTLDSLVVPKKTFLIIDKKINWIKKEEHASKAQAAVDWLEAWRSNWEQQNIESYIDNYSVEFISPPYNIKTWREHKRKLKDRYTYVKVVLSEPNILQVKDQYVIQFVQQYESNEHKDLGIKTLHVLTEDGKLKIKREDWTPL